MAQVKKGDTIKVHYKGTLTDGSLFDSSEGKEPLEFTVGEQMVIYGFDNGVLDMQVGDKKTLNIPCLEAYGEMNTELMIEIPKSELPEELGEVTEGMQLNMVNQDGYELPVEVIEIKEDAIVLDGNHPLAGQDLIFEVELVEIVNA
ncbi:MAG: peptidylprolyl isomerase [Bacteroidetes bacterium]|jgi:FKBP-type peptidyl-prolyl cis-trans isomerase 2|nr:peptidylprolyl isomerase [Bacteroidota bacterium]HQW47111.1 peptidylprolyl isomerase [Chitinophagaceae bacterium]MBK6820005.1 peptidylprolyl isomerase [Bacteroidota bacterium]MBK7588066.1 peptidylprolyl isomerase [Bacteroidota bacterium]MBK9301904.1 peptidylprolyl isomerase [Bacteroidota bacterium]